MIEKELLSYLAGYFDGEGSIYAFRSANRKTETYHLRIAVVTGDVDCVSIFHRSLGGWTSNSTRPNRTKKFYGWYVVSGEAIKALRQLLPYLRSGKRIEAEAVLAVDWETDLRVKPELSKHRKAVRDEFLTGRRATIDKPKKREKKAA
jgi:intein/homing endonuclease